MRQMERARAEAMQWPILEPIDADGQVNPVALNKPVCVAGDRSRVNLPLHSSFVSRAHALFVVDADGVYLRDLASRNGVAVNDDPVRETVLHNGDVVRIGPFSFRCVQNFAPANGAAQSHAEPAELRLPQDGARIPLTGRTIVIGSRQDCDVHISDEKVSAVHAVVFEREGRRFIRDLRSATGTWVNDEQVGQIELKPADSIRVGNTELAYAPVEALDAPPEIEPALDPTLDEISLSADDSLMAQPRPSAAPQEPAAAEPVSAPVPDDSAIIPLLDEDAEPRPAAVAPQAPEEKFESPPPPPVAADAAEPPQTPEIDVIPVLEDSDLAPQATAAELLEEHPAESGEPIAEQRKGQSGDAPEGSATEEPGPLPGFKGDPSHTFEVHPGTADRAQAEEVFSELLDELAENVEEVQTVWDGLKTSTEPPGTEPPPGGERTDQARNEEAPPRGRGSSKRRRPTGRERRRPL